MTTQIHTAIVYRTITGRYAFRSLSKAGTPEQHYRASNGHWATRAYAAKVAKECGFQVEHEA